MKPSSLPLLSLLSPLFLFLLLLPSASAECAFLNMFQGPTESCLEEYNAGQEPGAEGCFRDADCFGFSCRSPALGETELIGTYIPCNATMVASLIGPGGDTLITVEMPVDEFEISFGVIKLEVVVLQKDAGYLEYQIDVSVMEVPMVVLGPFSFGEPNCVWNQAHCSILYIYIGIGVGAGLLVVGIITCCCCCCCRKRKQVNQQYTMLEEPFIANEKKGSVQID